MRIGMGCPAACYLRSLLKKETEAKEALNAAMAEAKAQAAEGPSRGRPKERDAAAATSRSVPLSRATALRHCGSQS